MENEELRIENELKPYNEYKKVNLLWLDNVPLHWSVLRGKQLFNSKKQLNRNNECNNILSLTLRGVVNNSYDNPEGLVPKDYGTYQIFEKDDLVFKLIDLENYRTSRVGIVHEKGIMSPAYIRLTKQTDLNIRYFYHQYFDLYLRGIYNQLGAGVRSTLSSKDLINLCIVVPPRDEQDQIVKYLDCKLAKINKFIKAKKKLIAALKEQKQVVINEAVTKGINPNVKMKPSGIEWLGNIPEHWEIKRAKYYLMQIDKKSNDGKEQLLTVSHITGVTPRSEKNVNMFMAESTEGYKICEKDMIAINTMWAWMGAIGVSRYNGIISPSYHTYKQKDKDNYDNDYLDNLLRVNGYIDEYRIRSTGIRSSRLRLYPDKFLEIFIVRPPISEQKNIGKYIHKKSESINRSIHSIEQEIELITEYRTSLISDVVIGKVDVRHIEIGDIIEEDTEIDEIEDEVVGMEEILDNDEE